MYLDIEDFANWNGNGLVVWFNVWTMWMETWIAGIIRYKVDDGHMKSKGCKECACSKVLKNERC